MSRRTLGGICQASKIHTACSHLSVKVNSRAVVIKGWEDGGGRKDGESYAVEWRNNPNGLRHRVTAWTVADIFKTSEILDAFSTSE